MSSSRIGIDGCSFISKAKWQSLLILHLGYFEIMKALIQSETKDVNILSKPNGVYSPL